MVHSNTKNAKSRVRQSQVCYTYAQPIPLPVIRYNLCKVILNSQMQLLEFNSKNCHNRKSTLMIPL